MSESLTQQTKITKQPVRGKGVVVSQNVQAARVGAEILRKGGNAIDAAVATGMAIGALEPWMSGIGGVGFMTIWSAKERRAWTVDYGPISAAKLDPAQYKIVGPGPANYFAWPDVLERRNEVGYHSIAVPGMVAGLAKALERFGTMPWKDVLAPGVALAERGMELDWYMQLQIANGAANLSKFPASKASYLCDEGRVPTNDWKGTKRYIKLGNLGETMRRLAEGGPREFYEGSLARDIAADLQAGGSAISYEDLKAYEARIVEPLAFDHHGVTINVAGGLTAGPTLQRTLQLTGSGTKGKGAPDGQFFVAIAEAMHQAYQERLTSLGDKPTNTCTTHFCAADSQGNMVALTQTLMSLFGSGVMLPKTGITMNNGMLWFDPEPNRPNSIAPGKRPLCNICPVVVVKNGEPWFCIGASGGRRIVPAVTQLSLMLIDRGLDVEAAFHQPRLDISGVGPINVNRDIADDIKKAIAAKLPIVEVANQIHPLGFANPSCIVRDASTGELVGMNEVMSPWAGGAAQ
ncbi:gamma-glutamyltranspeptidase / glutathione hydrolase [Enhydrobacter aerosaccus]|uniref:Gamma-glutamyltranspeptidase / glutathione hydrolase n=1 Tax=Enhydrobacter aerosaccus TaxID=225324 RepID=A0A1T4S1R8_9HYPH|nr:gamma-glutamyltransferase [Enhydrobacter aerosaccus]SKA22239.1 gamma-glutamyltranspeptidase / glutathione hydrolase [Enhydrobacter aerosaccus]